MAHAATMQLKRLVY